MNITPTEVDTSWWNKAGHSYMLPGILNLRPKNEKPQDFLFINTSRHKKEAKVLLVKKNICSLFCLAMFIFCSLQVAGSIEAKTKEEIVAVKELTGEVVSFYPRLEPKFITIGVDKENSDYMFIIAEDVKLVHKRDLSQINVGDTIRVRYHLIKETFGRKEEKSRTKQVAKVIKFVKPRSKALISK